MRVAETGRQFQTIAERTVETNVRRPDKSQKLRQNTVKGQSKGAQQKRKRVVMNQAVSERAALWPREVTKHRGVGHKEQKGKGNDRVKRRAVSRVRLNELLGLVDREGRIWMNRNTHWRLGQETDDLVAEFVSQ